MQTTPCKKKNSWRIEIFSCPLFDMFSNANSHQQKERKMEEKGKTDRGTKKGRTRERERKRKIMSACVLA